MARGAHNQDMAVGVTQLGYIGLGVSNLDAWKIFGTQVLGFQDNGQSAAGETYFRIDDYFHRIILVPNGTDDIAFYGWEVKDGPTLDVMAAKLRANGFEVTEGTKEETEARKVRRLIKFSDPDGVPAEMYFGATVDHRPFVSPRVVHGFNANNLGFGHMVLSVRDPDAYVEFATGVLGARVSDYVVAADEPQRVKGTFLHVNPRHHSLAVGKNPTGKGRRLNHIMVELNDIDDVGRAFNLFQERGIAVGPLGRHTNDKMISFYGVTPSGYAIEYGSGGLRIDDESKWEVQVHREASLWGHGRPDRAAK